jgi:acyl-CoA dehydrogenase
MTPFLGPEQQALGEQLAAIDGFVGSDAAIARALGERYGLYRWLLPADGAAVDVRSVCVIRRRLGYLSPVADSIFAVQGLGSYPLALAGNAEQRERWLPGLRDGRVIAGFALTEPEAGSDVAAMTTTATPDGDGYRLHGTKTLISNLGIADQYVVFAKVPGDDGGKPHRRITAFVVASGSEGLAEEPIVLGAPHPIGTLRFAGCRIDRSARLGDEGSGFRLAMHTLDTFRVSVGAAAVGMGQRALDEALRHVCGRRQFGQPLAHQQVVQSYLADMATELDASWLLVLRAAFAKDQGQDRVTVEAAMAKLFATEAAQRVIDRAVQLFGGRGVVHGEVVENLYRAIRPLRIYEGTSEIQRLIIGRALVEAHQKPAADPADRGA